MSQEFDIHRELWDYYDDSSRRVTDFYEKDEVSISGHEQSDDFLHQLNHFIEELDKKEPVTVVEPPSTEPKKLDTPQKVYDHIKDNHK